MSVSPAAPGWERESVGEAFYAEGAAAGDIDGDGATDLVYGPFWFAGPGFGEPRRFAEGEPFSPFVYADNFFSFVRDIDGDGSDDILVFGFPGREARLFLNPGTDKIDDGGLWPVRVVADKVGHEAPHFVELVGGGLPEIVCSRGTAYGYYRAGADPTQPWSWHAISGENEAFDPFGHGMGVGDLNGDGRPDVIERMHWFEQPADPSAGAMWTKHRWALLPYSGGAQILVDDYDGDGDADFVTSLQAHAYGIAWFEQTEPGKFARHGIMGESSTDSPYGVCFTQPHAMARADIDGDGRNDFVTGKRWKAHNGKDPGSNQPAVVYWFRNVPAPGGGVEFVPHLVDDNSGVGVGVTVADLNGDGQPDIVSANKMGLAYHLQSGADKVAEPRWKTAAARPQDRYGAGLSAEESLAQMEVPEGFEVDLIASEPDLVQPIAMCFDARGRLWVVEGLTYPQRAPDGEGKDRILIFEDADADGSFESRKVFAEGINLASAIEVGFGGVFVGAAPHLLFIPDRDRDDRPDGGPEVLLDGWGYEDTHETLNTFTWGPDGWLYGCHGVFTHSKVGKPGTPEDGRVPLNAGVWRYHPTTGSFEVFAHGTSNPWGLDFDAQGEAFISACVIPHFFHMVQGGRYVRQSGQHFNPYTYTEIKTIADHQHYAGAIQDHAFWGDNFAARPPAPSDTSALGGGHAHCGLALYLADEFPPEFRGDAFFHNLHGHRIVREHLEPDGAGFTARHRPDFLLTNNHDFIGVGVCLGPDGALYFSDWADPQTCHHRDVEIWDRTDGRLFRVRHGGVKPQKFDLWAESDGELVSRLASPNAFFARHAQRVLQERCAAGEADAAALRRELLVDKLPDGAGGDEGAILRRLWTAHACGLLDEDVLVKLFDSESAAVRAWAVRLVGEPATALSDRALSAVETLAEGERAFVVRRSLASLLQRLPLGQRWALAASLASDPLLAHDKNTPLLVWYGIEPLVGEDAGRALALAGGSPWGELEEFAFRRATATEAGRDALVASLADAGDAAAYVQRAKALLGALENLPAVGRPDGWEAARARADELDGAGEGAVADVVRRLGMRFGDPDFFPHWRAVVRDRTLPVGERAAALGLLADARDPEIGALGRGVLDEPAMRAAAVEALRLAPGVETAEAVVSRLGAFPVELRTGAVNLLASRADMGLVLLRAVDAGEVPPSLISPVLLDQFDRFDDPEITGLVERHWVRGHAGVDLDQLAAAIEAWKKKLNPNVLAKADASKGREIYQNICGNCHPLFGEGVAIGPDLTGSNRADLGYLLENVLAPSAVVGTDYLLQIFTMADGSVVSGMVQKETPQLVRVALPGGTPADLAPDEIKSRQQLAQSLMPPGLFDALPTGQVADLVKYLASPNQVALPGEAVAGGVPTPAEGAIRIEGEALAGTAKATAGRAAPQPMGAFNAGAWSGGSQLWWTGGRPGDTLTLTLTDIPPGRYHLALFPTAAVDYAKAAVRVGDAVQGADFFSPVVTNAEPIHFEDVAVTGGRPLAVTIEITGHHPEATPHYMVGIDRVELAPRRAPRASEK